jgi:GTPase involved in cell partitioning and DNA repair
MSEFAFFRFRSHSMLTKEEEEHKEEIVQLTEEVLQAKGIECDASISKISEDDLKEILVKVRELRKKKRKKQEAAKQEEGYLYKGR